MTKPKGIFKKRKFRGNKSIKITSNNLEQQTFSVTQPQSRPTDLSSSVSASKRKLSNDYSPCSDGSVNVIMDLNLLSSVINNSLACKLCGGQVSLSENSLLRNGLASSFVILCNVCDNETQFWNSEKCSKTDFFEVNTILFYGMRYIGKGPTASKILCGIMNLYPPPTNTVRYTNVLGEILGAVAQESMKNAVTEAVEINEGKTDICIAFDATWQKRGHVSKNSCATATSFDTGKVVDVEILTKYCHACSLIGDSGDKKNHKCHKNYEGTSGGMESAASIAIFHRSIATRGVRYTQYLGDGDSSSFKNVLHSRPYDVPITKLECVGHIQKRMGSRLRKFKIKLGSKVLSDGKTIKGAGRLTDKVIDELQTFYGNAIRNNQNNLTGMKQAIWATYFHRLSTDMNPMHQLCPPPPNTWCKHRKAQENNTVAKFHHKNSIPEAVMLEIKPIFKDLADPELLKKCLHGKTQNVNESFNNVVWSRIPKNVFVGRKTLEMGVWDAAITFNDGNVTRLKVLKEFGVRNIGQNTENAMINLDKLRVVKAEIAVKNITKEARLDRRRKRLNLQDLENDNDYSPGSF